MTLNRHLVIFAKAPRMGRVKTRLAKDIGTVWAWSFFRHALAGLLRRLSSDPRWNTIIAVAPDTAMGSPVWPADIDQTAQGLGDLGERMQRAFDELPHGPVVIVGADIPGITPKHVSDAFDALGNHDAVFGQADDGGYWLVGLKRSPRIRQIFKNVRWSGPHALSDTVANLNDARIALLEPLIDVDDGRDYQRWRTEQKNRP